MNRQLLARVLQSAVATLRYRNFGVGILDAEQGFGAPLPDWTEVECTHRLALEEVATTKPAGERVAALFPDLTADEVVRRLSALWGTSGDALAVKLERHEAELARIFSERCQAWDSFMDTPADGPRYERPAWTLRRLSAPNPTR